MCNVKNIIKGIKRNSAVEGFEPWTSVFSDLDKQNEQLTQKAKSSCALEEEKCADMVLN